MKEMLRNGPINGDFEAPPTFGLYKEGILSEDGLLDLHKKSLQLAQTNSSNPSDAAAPKISDTTLNDKGMTWMNMSHAVFIVGWGTDDKTG